MLKIEEREQILNKYFTEGKGYGEIAKIFSLKKDTVKSLCKRYRIKNNIPTRGNTPLRKEPIKKEQINKRESKKDFQEVRIARLEMEVDLLRNFLILTERG